MKYQYVLSEPEPQNVRFDDGHVRLQANFHCSVMKFGSSCIYILKYCFPFVYISIKPVFSCTEEEVSASQATSVSELSVSQLSVS